MKNNILAIALILPFTATAQSRGTRADNVESAARSSSQRGAAETAAVKETVGQTQETCRAAIFKCMDAKVAETVTQMDILYDDYNDMITNVYGGMKVPPFKCLYDDQVKTLYTKYYFGLNMLSAPDGYGSAAKVESNSIEFYNYLKQNAMDGASKKISATEIDAEVLKIAGISARTSGSGTRPPRPVVNYKITAYDPDLQYKTDSSFCLSPDTNKEVAGCEKLLDGALASWKNKSEPTLEKSCEDYKIFLTGKLAKSEKEAREVISGFKAKIAIVIDDYNKNEASKKKLGK